MGPLAGLKVVELAGIGPGPFCAMLFSDMGAEVIRVDRTQPSDLGFPRPHGAVLLNRGRRSVAIDLKNPDGVEALLRLAEQADALIESFRPGVAERLGIGPDACLARNPRLVYGRMTGWGQTGPLAHVAGHDINYIALTGALHSIGPRGGPPVHPLNLVGDFAGGALYLAYGVLAAVFEAGRSGQGQVVDASMVEGVASLMTGFFGLRGAGAWTDARGDNIVDGGSHFYGVYETKDGKHISLGAIEPKFYKLMVELLGLEGVDLSRQLDRAGWQAMREKVAAAVLGKTRDEWCEILEGTDVCFAPILDMAEATEHPHNKARGTFVEVDGFIQPGPVPKFSRTPPAIQGPAAAPGAHTEAVLADWGFGADEIAALEDSGAVGWQGPAEGQEEHDEL